eukprot:TRINITY_DN2620_c0_g1_i2.p2 TRINITY_DN2620_c0_g1~~TRINITY_DN2620_c0_g1_i2.p2  ORF type:complete len:154 (+),score=36.08 TRINITY_DN2620_c0_g1_i2:213-674(+)
MTLLRVLHFPQWTFSLYFLASLTPDEMEELWAQHKALFPDLQQGDALDPTQPNEMTKLMWQPCLELTYNHGCEADPDFHVHNGNTGPQGFGHIGFLVDNLDETCDAMEAAGVSFKKKSSDGKMQGIAFAYDPDGYWVELIDRKVSCAGVCSNY